MRFASFALACALSVPASAAVWYHPDWSSNPPYADGWSTADNGGDGWAPWEITGSASMEPGPEFSRDWSVWTLTGEATATREADDGLMFQMASWEWSCVQGTAGMRLLGEDGSILVDLQSNGERVLLNGTDYAPHNEFVGGYLWDMGDALKIYSNMYHRNIVDADNVAAIQFYSTEGSRLHATIISHYPEPGALSLIVPAMAMLRRRR